MLRRAIEIGCTTVFMWACVDDRSEPGATAASDASTSDTTTTTDATADATTATDTGPDVAPLACEPLGGLYLMDKVCSEAPKPGYQHFLCVRQSACDIAFETVYPQAQLTGTVVYETWSASDAALDCAGRIDGDVLAADCDHVQYASCDLQATRYDLPGYSKVCCDVTGDDCPSGQRCTLVEVEGIVGNVPVCEPHAGAVALDGACDQFLGPSGQVTDDCAPGLGCVRMGQPSVSACRPLCDTQDACAEGELCKVSDGYTLFGHCLVACDPFAGCPGGARCTPIPAYGPGVSFGFAPTCIQGSGDIAEGAACDDNAPRCQPGLQCTPSFGAASGSRCARYCDPAHACPSGQRCRPGYPMEHQWPRMDELGFCEPE